jgi:glycosyltransferase involved in cell wall biosynthesis
MCLDSDDAIQKGYLSGLVPYLEADGRLGIVYTRLFYIKPDGESGISPWPGEFNADEQLSGKNQIPTAALTTRKVWERLGGQRQRYAPVGAGAEDADFWLRAVSYGFGARFVPLPKGHWFIYAWLSGMVSGNKDYREVDYRHWSPWAKDRTLLPTPCSYIEKNAHLSNPARWYDNPIITVVVPVSSNHIGLLDNALDSLDAQTFKNFEIIVVFDTTVDVWKAHLESGRLRYIANTWPACRFTSTGLKGMEARDITSKLEADMANKSILDDLPLATQARGPAVARNAGVALASAPLLFFLDADDWLEPETFKKMLDKFRLTGNIIYSDHIGIAPVKKENLNLIDGKVMAYNDGTGIAYIQQGVSDYECELAMEQPLLDGRPPYVICNVSALVPKKWVVEIGGFDESMRSWEDVLLWWRLAWSGKCFSRVPEPLLVYRYNTGSMREIGREKASALLQYVKKISDGVTKMGCNCNDKQTKALANRTEASMTVAGGARLKLSRGGFIDVSDSDLIMVELNPRNDGNMARYGVNDFGGGQIFYGYRQRGDRFLAHRQDVSVEESMAMAQGRQPEFVRVVSQEVVVAIEDEVIDLPPPPTFSLTDDVWDEVVTEEDVESIDIFPEPVESKRLVPLEALDFDVQNREFHIAQLYDNGIRNALDLIAFDKENENYGGLASLPRVGEKTREAMLEAANKAIL